MYVAANLTQCLVLNALVMLSGGKTIYGKTFTGSNSSHHLSIHIHGWRLQARGATHFRMARDNLQATQSEKQTIKHGMID